MVISSHDKTILRRLAEQWAAIAALPVHKEKAELWRRCNDLEKVRPMVWITEIPWHEFSGDDDLGRIGSRSGIWRLESTGNRSTWLFISYRPCFASSMGNRRR